MSNIKIIILTVLLVSSIQLNSFPGDHNSLTCINNLFIAPDDDRLFTTAEELRKALYGTAYLINGVILNKYNELGCPGSSMGFPVSDVYSYHFGSMLRADFECGTIEKNILDLVNPIYVSYHSPKPAGCK